jgi:hypothetical protein
LQSGTKGASNPSPAVERTFIGEYKNPWESNPAQEIAMIQAGSNPQSGKHWSPGTVDFQALSQGTLLADSYPSFLAWLLKEKPGSLKRVNIITHGDFSRIGFKGTIDVQNGGVVFDSDPDSSLTLTSLNKWRNGPLIDDNNKSHTFDEIKAKFAHGAEIFIFSCNGASDPQLLQELADAFGVKVNGISKEVVYCVVFDTSPPRVQRSRHKVAVNDQPTLLQSCAVSSQSDFHNLKTNRSASPKKKTP